MATREPKKPAAKSAAAPEQQPAPAEPAKEIALKPDERVRNQLAKMTDEIKHAIGPAAIDVEKFKRVCATAIIYNKDLMKVWAEAPQTLFAACLKCAADGLVPDGREAALVKYNVKKEGGGWMAIAQYMPMVQGLVKLVMNTGTVADIMIETVRERDEFDIQLGDEPRYMHKPALKNRGGIIGAYSIVTYVDGTKSRQWMDIDAILAIKERSKVQDGPWKTDLDQMCCKTVFRRHCKKLGRSSEQLERALVQDNTFFNYQDVLPAAVAGDGAHPQAADLKGQPKPAPQKASRMKNLVRERKQGARPAEPIPDPQVEDGVIEGDFRPAEDGPPPGRFDDGFDGIDTNADADDGAPL